MRARIGGAIGMVAVALVVACNDGDQPSTLPASSPTSSDGPASATASPTPTGDSTAELEAEITEFLNEYAQVINDSWASADALAQRRKMFADSCVSCTAGYRLAEQAQVDGLRFEDGEASLRELELDRIEGDIVTVSAFTNSEAGRLVDPDGNVVQELDASSNVQIIYQLRRRGSGSWIIISGEVLD